MESGDEQKLTPDIQRGSGEARFHALVEQSLVGIYMIQDGILVYVNPRMAEIHGYTVDELINVPAIELVAPEDRELFHENSRKRLEGEVSSLRYALRVLRKDGKRRFVEVHGTRIDHHGRPAILGSLIDVTERHEAESELASAHHTLQHLLAHSPAVIYSLGWNGEEVKPAWVSENITRLLGFSIQEALNPAWWIGQVHPDDLPHALTGLKEILELGHINRQYRIRHKEGQFIWVEDSQQLVADAAGNPREIVGVWADITQRKKAEIDLRESEARARVIADSSSVGIFMTSPEGRNLYTNAAFQEVFGVPLEETLGDRWSQTIHPDDRERVTNSWQRFVQGIAPKYDLEARWLRPDGEVRVLHARATSIHEGNRLIGHTGTVVDITERKRTEEALIESEAQFRTSFEMAVVGQVQADFRTGKMLRVNAKFCQITGYSEAELLGMTFYELNHPEEVPQDRVTMDQLTKGLESVFYRNKRYIRKDGRVIWVEVNAVLIRDSQGHPLRTSAVVQEITQRKETELALQAMNDRYARQESAISSLARSYSRHRGDLPSILKEITEITARTLEVDRASIWRYGPDQQSIVCVELFEKSAQRHSDGTILQREHFPGYFAALKESEIIDAHDAHADPRTREFSDVYLRPLGINSMLDAHLQAEGHPVGVLCCEQVGPKREWTADEQTFAVAVANLVSLLLSQAERAKLEQQLRQAQKMEAIGQLAGGVAHDFNNILGAILGYTEMARLDAGDNPAVLESLDAVNQASRRAT
ncbi:MAG: putative Hybrid histidine kinase, partial [Verrucomicrobia bacterium]|nr:putative Hybrid histidine kinase [Verrucomicrobiota bacterium]